MSELTEERVEHFVSSCEKGLAEICDGIKMLKVEMKGIDGVVHISNALEHIQEAVKSYNKFLSDVGNISMLKKKVLAWERYNTRHNTPNMFPVGAKVKVVSPMVDYVPFNMHTGVVIYNEADRFEQGIKVRFDQYYEYGGAKLKTWCFSVHDLVVL